MKSEKALLLALLLLLIIVLLLFVAIPANAAAQDYRKWLLEYEQIDGMGYPAPVLESTATYGMGYPAPALEPTATAKPKKKQEPEPTISAITKSKCSLELTSAWWTAAWLGQAYVYTNENGVAVYCIGDLPDKYNAALWTPTPAPTQSEIP